MTMMSSEACDPPVKCLWKLEDGADRLSYRCSMFKTFVSTSECSKDIVIKLNLCTFLNVVLCLFTHDVYHMCVNLILAHICDAFDFPCKIRCDSSPLTVGKDSRDAMQLFSANNSPPCCQCMN
jgi:hypothetical protein